jgi:DNA polymerase I
MSRFFTSNAYRLEIDTAEICAMMEENGVLMDRARSHTLLADLENAGAEIAATLQAQLPPEWVEEPFTPKRDNKTKGYVAGQVFIKRKLTDFNPNSGPQFADRIIRMHGWQPTVLTEGGAPCTNSAVLAGLPFPEAATLLSHKIVSKRVTMLTGPSGYLTKVADDGCLHTRYNALGTVTGRATHSPNIAQVPGVRLDQDGVPLQGVAGAWGLEFRSLFIPPPGWLFIGADQAGLELRGLAHALSAIGGDGGAYAVIVTTGDPHTANQNAAGLSTRAQAKRFVFAVVYGAGDLKAGSIVEPDEPDEYIVRSIGRVAKQNLIDGISGFKQLFRYLDGFNHNEIPGLDGRPLFARYKHSRLNTMLQGMGAILCKRWLVLIQDELQRLGLIQGHHGDYMWSAWIHDEILLAARTREIAAIVARVCEEQAVLAGVYYDLECPLAAKARIGDSWAAVH